MNHPKDSRKIRISVDIYHAAWYRDNDYSKRLCRCSQA